MELSKELQTAIDAARKGAEVALSYYNVPLDIETKHDNSPVTIADHETEKTIIEYITSVFPTSKFLAEESGGSSDKEEFWVIDPIDGTSSFARGIPLWCILISFCRKEEVIAAVCYFPLLDELLVAEKGKGAFRNGQQLSVSTTSDLTQAYLSYSNPRHFPNKEKLLDIISQVKVARSPEPTFSAFLLATGRYDILLDINAKSWDTTAVKLIIEESGGKVTDMQGKEWNFSSKGYIATNGILHEAVLLSYT